MGTGPSIAGLSVPQTTLGAAGTVSLSGKTPSLGGISGLANAVVINVNPITSNSNGVEMPTSYTVQWSASNDVDSSTGALTSPAGSATFAATGANGNGVWFLNPANVTGLNAGSSYYFQVQGVAGSSFSNWSSPSAQIALSAASADNTVTGNVTWTGTATGPLYVGFYDMSSGAVWGQVAAARQPPTSGVPTRCRFPAATMVCSPWSTTITTASSMPRLYQREHQQRSSGGDDLRRRRPAAHHRVAQCQQRGQCGTSYRQVTDLSGNSTSNYTLNFKISEGNELPVAVTLTGGPNLINPIDLEYCGNNCGKPEFDYSLQLNNGVMPNVNDTYAFHVTYSGARRETSPGQ